VIVSRIDYEADGYTVLTERAIQLLRLTEWIVGVNLSLQQKQGRPGRAYVSERTLAPRVAGVLPGLAVVAAVIP